MKHSRILWACVGVLLLATACTHDHEDMPTPVPDNVQLKQDNQLGSILTDVNGKTLYFFSNDASGKSTCVDGCAITWPVFYVDVPNLPAGLASSDFGTIKREDGKPQTTYKGWPLYYYSKDSVAGDKKGEAFGSRWFTAKPDYTVMLAYNQLIGSDKKHYNSHYMEGDEVVPYLTDAYGRTLYSFSTDKLDSNTFTHSDFLNNPTWPIDTLNGVQRVPSLFSTAEFHKVNVFGKSQISFRGWPLYYFGADSSIRGNTRGVSFPRPGGVWPVVNLNTVMATR